MPFANLKNSTPSAEAGYDYLTEASDLGLPPGFWPREIETDLGNGLPFVFDKFEYHDGDFAGAIYRQRSAGARLFVLND